MNKTILHILIGIGAAIVGYFSGHWLGPDNPVEEACETVIQAETGQKVDLSENNPVTPTPAPTTQETKI